MGTRDSSRLGVAATRDQGDRGARGHGIRSLFLLFLFLTFLFL
jgi:hypothetical protein